MANFTALKTAINNAIKTNGNEEITGAILQAILDAMVETLGDSAINDLENAITTEVTNRENAVGGVADDLAAEVQARQALDYNVNNRINAEEYNRQNADAALSQTMSQGFQTLGSQMTALNAAISALNAAYQNGFLYGGIANPSSSPSNNKCFYIALQGGTYTNFGGVGVVEGINIIKNDSGWKVEHIYDQTTLLNEFYLLRQQVIQAITSFAPIVIEGDVTNAPDEEDLTSNANHLLQFKNNAYSPLEFSGLGRKYLRKNIAPLSESAPFNGFVEGVTAEETLSGTPTQIFWDRMNTRFVGIKDGVYYLDWTDSDNYVPVSTSLVYMYNDTPYQWTGSDFIVDETEVPNLVNCLTQDMINEPNTIYIIRYDYTLKEDITIPANCVLEFDGGSISAGSGENMNTINGNRCTVAGNLEYNIFNNCVLKDFDVPYFDLRWFGAIPDFIDDEHTGTDSAFAFDRALNNAVINHLGTPIKIVGQYYLATAVETTADCILIGTHFPSRVQINRNVVTPNPVNVDYTEKSPSALFVKSGITAITLNGIGEVASTGRRATHFNIDGLKLSCVGNAANTIFIKSTTFGSPSIISGCNNTEAFNFDKVFYFTQHPNSTAIDGTHTDYFKIGDNVIFMSNIYNVYVDAKGQLPSLCGFSFRNSVLKGHGRGRGKFVMPNIAGYGEVINCLLEGGTDIFNISAYGEGNAGAESFTNILIKGNYFEVNDGENNFDLHGGELVLEHNSYATGIDLLWNIANTKVILNETQSYFWDNLRMVDCICKGIINQKMPLISCCGVLFTGNCGKVIDGNDFVISSTNNATLSYGYNEKLSTIDGDIVDANKGISTSYDDSLGVFSISEHKSIGDYMAICFYKGKGGMSFFITDDNTSKSFGYYGVPAEEGLYVLIKKLTQDNTTNAFRVNASANNVLYSRAHFATFTQEEVNNLKVIDFAYYPYKAAIAKYGTIRPRQELLKVGDDFFDETLSKPIWYKGNNVWVDATGATV